uniref:Acylamino-acid-releasing enzyme N-terminal domain-containing protein n=1 Tax=Timema poppense TaxID=170557 RepID=A0A7R9H7Q8_TIMPO|nr:unnamed protein product [Timema poppensis]
MRVVENIVKVFKKVAQYPSPTAARILKPPSNNGGLTITSVWSQRNLEREKSIKFQQTHFVDLSLQKSTDMYPVDISFELLSSLSKSEELRAVVREIPTDTTSKKQYLEVWKLGQLYRNFDLAALEVHGDVYADGDFVAFDWSPCEQKVLYIAEKKSSKSEPFTKVKPQETNENKLGGGNKTVMMVCPRNFSGLVADAAGL